MKPAGIIAIVIVVIVIIGGAWYAYSNPAIAAMLGLRHAGGESGTATSTGYHGFGGNRGGFAMGSIEVLNGNDFTITLSDGTTKIIDTTATTTLENYASASSTPTAITIDQLSVGEQVFVVGSPNSDGSINAARVMTGTLPTRPTGGFGAGRFGSSTGSRGHYPPPVPD